MNWFVVNLYKGNYSIQGVYKSHEAAQRRCDAIQGGQTSVFGPLELDNPEDAIRKFREEELKTL